MPELDEEREAYEVEVIREVQSQLPPDPSTRYERRTFHSKRRGRWDGWRFSKRQNKWIHRERKNREVKGHRIVDLIFDRLMGTFTSVAVFPWDTAATECYPDDPDSEARLIEALGGEQDIPFNTRARRGLRFRPY